MVEMKGPVVGQASVLVNRIHRNGFVPKQDLIKVDSIGIEDPHGSGSLVGCQKSLDGA